MKRLFNKTFFKFAFGFAGVVAVVVLAVLALGSYQMVAEDEAPFKSTKLIAD